MENPEPRSESKLRVFCRNCLRRVGKVARVFLQAVMILWATLALHFSNLPWAWARTMLAIAFAVFAIWALWITRRKRMTWAFLGAFAIVLVWFILIPPSHDRPWRREVAILPRAFIDGDRVRLTGVRNFDYRSRHDFDERWEEREVDISHLKSIDFFISYWTPGPVGHTFLSFNFDNAEPVCISIETRPEVGEAFAPISSMFKEFELVYIVGSERDLVRSRTDYRDELVYMYRMRASPEACQRLFLIYLERINSLADHAEWYDLLSNSCTINIVRYANLAGRSGRWSLKHFLNGWIDQYLYAVGAIDSDLPFDELRAKSQINQVAKEIGDAPDFSQRIRAAVPSGPG